MEIVKKVIRRQQIICLVCSFIIALITYDTYQNRIYYDVNLDTWVSYFGYFSGKLIIFIGAICILIVIYFGIFKKNKNDQLLKAFPLKESANLSNQAKQIFYRYKLSQTLIVNSLVVLLVYALFKFYICNDIHIFDQISYRWINQGNDSILWMPLIILILLLVEVLLLNYSNLKLIKDYREKDQLLLEVLYLLLHLNRGSSNRLLPSLILSFASGGIGLHEETAILQLLEKMNQLFSKKIERNINLKLIYYFDCYVLAYNCNLKEASNYRHNVEAILNGNKKIGKKLNCDYIKIRLKADDLLLGEDYQGIIELIEGNQTSLKEYYRSLYFQYLLYLSYQHVNDDKANLIYNRLESNPRFKEYIKKDVT